jgi:glycosyltransferase involved in cell wall biosynthesis
MAHGRPLVATRVGGLADLEGPGVMLVPPRDVPALRGAICELLDGRERRVELGAEARAVAAAFSPVLVAEKLSQVYRRAVLS